MDNTFISIEVLQTPQTTIQSWVAFDCQDIGAFANMAKNIELKSSESETTKTPVPIVDFLYADKSKIAQFMSQFDIGSLTTLTNQQTSLIEPKTGKHANFSVGVGGIASVGGGFGLSASDKGSHGISRIYEAEWVNVLSFMEFLRGKDMIWPDFQKAPLGGVIMVKGRIQLLDMDFIKSFVGSTSFKSYMKNNSTADNVTGANRHEKRANQAIDKKNVKQSNLYQDLAVELMKNHEYLDQITIIDSSANQFWGVLKPNELSQSVSTLNLMHGTNIAGDWNCLCTIDSTPNLLVQNFPTIHQHYFGIMAQAMVPEINSLMGKPAPAHGITPLVIFRETPSLK